MPVLTLLIKPASSLCNLNCKYCFYEDISENRQIKSYGLMTLATLEALVKRAFEYAENVCTFAFQGGEPTLVGLEFYVKLIEYVQIYNTKKIHVQYTLQTNGILIQEEWASFLANNRFLVGLSLDGPKEIHNLHRVDDQKDGTFNRVMKTVQILKKFQVEFNILYVVTAQSTRNAQKIYNFFKQNNMKYLQFIPCLDPINEERGQQPHSLKVADFTKFLKATFDLWYEDLEKGNLLSIRYFDNLLGMIMGYPPEACVMKGQCECQCVVEADGGVYPCDFYVLDEWHLGNVKERTLSALLSSEVGKKFVETSRAVASECTQCNWYSLCRGGCRRDQQNDVNYYCKAYKVFLEYAYPKLLSAARMRSNH